MIDNRRMRPPVLLEHKASCIGKADRYLGHELGQCAFALVQRFVLVADKIEIVLRESQKTRQNVTSCGGILELINKNKIKLILISRSHIRLIKEYLRGKSDHVVAIYAIRLLQLIF